MTLEYKESFLYPDAVRAYSGLSWAEIDMKTRSVLKQSSPSAFASGLTEEELNEATNAVANMTSAPYEVAFIRFGNLPKGGKSKNYLTGEFERGVSVYDATWNMVTGAYERSGGLDGAMINYMIKGAPVYLVTGERVGTGSDGEPIIRNASVLKRLRYDPDIDGYKEA